MFEERLEEAEELFSQRGFLKRACQLQKRLQEEEDEISEVESGEITDDPDSDVDYDPLRPKKKKKKVKLKKELEKPEKKPRKKKEFFKPPTFDQVMETQIHHLAKFIEYEDEEDSYEECSDENIEQISPVRPPLPTFPELVPVKEKRKRVVIYPWRPCGIIGGSFDVEESYLITRKPVDSVKKLIELETYY